MTSVEPWNFGLGIDGAKSRYSLAFLGAVCAQAGATMEVTRQDEDVHAVDAKVCLGIADVQVQLKCTWSPEETTQGIRLDLKSDWIEKWKRRIIPTYVVGVVVPKAKPEWISHNLDNVVHNTKAYWGKFNPESTRKSIVLPHDNRLTAESLATWDKDLTSLFGG